ncbi:MAG: PAS domain-containing sensor histidine kinase [Anaerolineae bacterium]|nr:PAS domain-containing sensor histidine kinase [Anaerolineae bacterium]
MSEQREQHTRSLPTRQPPTRRLAAALHRLRTRLDRRRLSVQMIATSIALVLLTAIAAGLPAIWLMRTQLYEQAWAQVDQGGIAAAALYQARAAELDSLATLAAGRPTLRELLLSSAPGEIDVYLSTLQAGSGLDLVVVCNDQGHALGRAALPAAPDVCSTGPVSAYQVLLASTGPQAWLIATQSVVGQDGAPLAGVSVGLHVDDDFATQMRAQTGLEHTLLFDGSPVATSLPGRRASAAVAPISPSQSRIERDGRIYYIKYIPVSTDASDAGAGELVDEIALDVTALLAAQTRLVLGLTAGIAGFVLLASLVGTYVARRISAPLKHLAEAAGAMSRGEPALTHLAGGDIQVREVALVARALESAQQDLARTLGELRQEKAWTDHLLASIVEGIVTLDRRGHITFFSPGAERITGWPSDQVLGLTCDQVFLPGEGGQPFSQLIPAPGRRVKIPVELSDGKHAILAVTGARLFPPELGDARVALVFRDVSEEEAVHRLLGDFLANVAHEFRTPLSALAASVELLLDQAPDLTTDDLSELLVSLHLGVLGLQTLIDNLLESASIEAGHFRVHPRPCSLAEIVADAVRTVEPLLDRHGQRLVVELPAVLPTVVADSRRTAQVLINLLSNAIKYGPDDAEIEIGATVSGEQARVWVADHGPGVPAHERHNLFRRFAHSQSTDNKARVGAGLGLSVVKAIVEGQGGQVGVDERRGGGSIFWFTLPLVEETV